MVFLTIIHYAERIPSQGKEGTENPVLPHWLKETLFYMLTWRFDIVTALIPLIKQPIKMPCFGTHNIQKGVLNSILIELVSRQSSRTVEAEKKQQQLSILERAEVGKENSELLERVQVMSITRSWRKSKGPYYKGPCVLC